MTDEKIIEKEDEKAITVRGEEFRELLKDKQFLQIPKSGDLVKGAVVSVSKSEVKIDLPGYRTGVVRGNELYGESEEFSGLNVGDEVEATVVDLENENGDVELSFRFAGQQKTWGNLDELRKTGEKVKVKVQEANKGGLIIKLFGIQGFIPVSQLSPENYPRVQGGDKSKILEKLRSLVGQEIEVKILDADQQQEKLIASEKQIWEEDQKENIAKYKVGDLVEGTITAVTDFGVFVKFDDLEGLIHISELAWQRIDSPQDLFKVGDKVKAVIVNIQGSRIFLSIKKLQDDPWKDVNEKYKIGDKVKAKVLKTNHFGLFVELDKDIHGLVHISELGKHKPEDFKENDEVEATIISIEPNEHRLGLSMKPQEQESKKTKKQENTEAEKKLEEEVREEASSEEKEEIASEEKPEEQKEKVSEPEEAVSDQAKEE
ncbi:MAG: 30S ribosomal protein S1 [Parcubacteria group bacterium CG10_big_fil_rev_8_21_14_0_10_36_14]|nr:MAG: 30S ribosomal protein S1 [Parcubacteria group bacterium CG10_big_fil_rev_8_21_14_0_10_36_14]